jgi:hypothetical protein
MLACLHKFPRISLLDHTAVLQGPSMGWFQMNPSPFSLLVGVTLTDISEVNMGNLTVFPGQPAHK